MFYFNKEWSAFEPDIWALQNQPDQCYVQLKLGWSSKCEVMGIFILQKLASPIYQFVSFGEANISKALIKKEEKNCKDFILKKIIFYPRLLAKHVILKQDNIGILLKFMSTKLRKPLGEI